ncbi:MAG TPA: chlorite dismutase family protein [Planctomycetota bacterium]
MSTESKPPAGAPPAAAPGAPPVGGPPRPAYQVPDSKEKGAPSKTGEPQLLDKRLYAQLQVYTDCAKPAAVVEAMKASGLEGAVYADVNDARGVALLTFTEDPSTLTGAWRELQLSTPFQGLRHRPEMTMVGKTYGTGREPNLDFALLKKPRVTALNPVWPWAIWYPLRRKATFATLDPERQGKILYEHAQIGMAFGAADYAHDVRLSCYGLDRDDNEFVIGLVGRELHPLALIVQEMRKTVQTSKYIRKLGPFFVGKALWQSPAPAAPGAGY